MSINPDSVWPQTSAWQQVLSHWQEHLADMSDISLLLPSEESESRAEPPSEALVFDPPDGVRCKWPGEDPNDSESGEESELAGDWPEAQKISGSPTGMPVLTEKDYRILLTDAEALRKRLAETMSADRGGSWIIRMRQSCVLLLGIAMKPRFKLPIQLKLLRFFDSIEEIAGKLSHCAKFERVPAGVKMNIENFLKDVALPRLGTGLSDQRAKEVEVDEYRAFGGYVEREAKKSGDDIYIWRMYDPDVSRARSMPFAAEVHVVHVPDEEEKGEEK